MARTQRIHVRRQLQELIPSQVLRSLALDTGFRKRERSLDLDAFVWTLAFGFGIGGDRAITALYDSYLSVAKESIGESSFGEWFRKPGLVPWTRGLVEHVMGCLDRETRGDEHLGAELARFKELLCADSSLVRLHWSLQKRFPGTRTNHSPASLKVHLVQKVHGSGLGRIKITEGRRADAKTLPVGPWIKGSLLLIDLGYYDFAKFSRVDSLGGYFISRVKTGANPLIVRSLKNHRGQAVDVDGMRLKDVLHRLKRKVIDLEVLVRFQARTYKGKKHYKEQKLRLVGVWNEEEDRHHLYFTNIAPEQLEAEAVAQAYGLRWQVELLFRQLKCIHGMGQVRVQNEYAAVGLVYAAILSLLVTRKLLEAVRETIGGTEVDVPFERGAKVVQRHAVLFLRLVRRPPRELGRLELDIESALLRKAPDRNRGRRLLWEGCMNMTRNEQAQFMAG